MRADIFIPKVILEKMKSPEVIDSIRDIMEGVAILRKVETDTEHFTIKAWVVNPGAGKKRAICVQIEEA